MTIFNDSYWQWSVVVKSSTRTSMEDRLSRVRTNHRPLEQVHKRNLMQAPPRLQRMLLRLQPYDCIIKYLPGREMVTADAL